MDGPNLNDEAVRDRIRAAAEFLDPSMFPSAPLHLRSTNLSQMTDMLEGCSRSRLQETFDAEMLSSYRADIVLMLNRNSRRLIVRLLNTTCSISVLTCSI